MFILLAFIGVIGCNRPDRFVEFTVPNGFTGLILLSESPKAEPLQEDHRVW